METSTGPSAAGAVAGAWQRLVEAFSNSNTASKAVVIAVSVLVVHWLFFRPRSFRGLPTWAPIEIALASHLVAADGLGRTFYSKISRYGGSLYGASSKHQVIIDMPNSDRFLSQGHHILAGQLVQRTIMTKVFGSPNTDDFWEWAGVVMKHLMSVVEKEFVNENASTACINRGHVEQEITSLVTFTSDPGQRKPWEISANPRLVTEDKPGELGAVEVDLQNILRYFGATIAIRVLYGKDFLDRNPWLIDDFWAFDNDTFPLLMVGIPSWMPLKAMKDGIAIRSRMTSALNDLYRRVDQYQKGEPVDFGADLSDIGIATERNKVYHKFNTNPDYRGPMDLVVLWGQNANTQPVLFWFVAYIHATPGLLDEIRKEMSPWIKTKKGASGTVEIESLDTVALARECPLTKSALYETFRMTIEATSLRSVVKPMTVEDGQYSHQLQPGTFVSVPHGAIQFDPKYFHEPEKFIPDRFLETDEATGKRVARYGKLRPWGVGPGMCKGRTFAEKEVLNITAALITVWDLQCADGAWNIPSMVPGTGVKKPVKDIRVVLKRRVIS
ncbi:putative cytochrome P450 [Xylariales sp. PMI_506]|nr:putative cytochrome P450 [Xylariales sp. PMI_506]